VAKATEAVYLAWAEHEVQDHDSLHVAMDRANARATRAEAELELVSWHRSKENEQNSAEILDRDATIAKMQEASDAATEGHAKGMMKLQSLESDLTAEVQRPGTCSWSRMWSVVPYTCPVLMFPTCTLKFPTCTLMFPTCALKFPTCTLMFPTCGLLFPACALKFPTRALKFPTCALKFPACGLMHPDVPYTGPDVPYMCPKVPYMCPDVPFTCPEVPRMYPDVPYMCPKVPYTCPEVPRMWSDVL
jgi:hypothetical protein